MKTKTKIKLLGIAFFVGMLSYLLYSNLKENRQTIMVGAVPMIVDVADNELKIKKGLMFKQSLDVDGMLFIFEEVGRYSFWMKNMNFPIDIAFVDESFKILEIYSLFPEKDLITPSSPIKYVLEAPLGWFEDRGVRVGDDLTLPSTLQP